MRDVDALAGRPTSRARDCGSLTSMPRWIIGAVTMKMISSTSITSTSGTTLISASDVDDAAAAAGRARRAAAGAARAFGIYVKFLSQMFRNSIAKSSISEANSFTRFDR